jgi:peptide/nickel transport system substrate-binding protein
MSFTKNANYWQSGKPYLDQVKTIFSADPQTATVQLEAGAVDDITRPSVRDAARLSQDPKYSVRRIEGSGGFFLLVCNSTLPPTDNKKFRQAINYAIDRQRLADTILLKQGGGPLNLPWPAHSPAYQANKNQTYTFDLDKARALVAGLPDLTMEIVVTPLTAQINDFAQVLQADLGQIGVTAKINTMERAAATPYTRNLQYKGIQFALGGLSQMSPSTLFVSSYYAYGNGANSHGFHGDRYVQLVDAVGTETDSAKQKALYSDLNDVMLDESVQMPMVEFSQVIASRAYVKGVRWRISLPRVWEDIWLDK